MEITKKNWGPKFCAIYYWLFYKYDKKTVPAVSKPYLMSIFKIYPYNKNCINVSKDENIKKRTSSFFDSFKKSIKFKNFTLKTNFSRNFTFMTAHIFSFWFSYNLHERTESQCIKLFPQIDHSNLRIEHVQKNDPSMIIFKIFRFTKLTRLFHVSNSDENEMFFWIHK